MPTYFFQFLSCSSLGPSSAIVGTTLLSRIILKDFHCLVLFHRHALFLTSDMMMNPQNWNHDVDVENMHNCVTFFQNEIENKQKKGERKNEENSV